MKRNNEAAKAATERRISKEINNRVFEESRIRNEKKRNAQDLKIEIAALSEVSDLQPSDVKKIAEEVRNEFAGSADLPKKKRRSLVYIAGVLLALGVAGAIVFPRRASLERQTQVLAHIKSLEQYGSLKDAVEKGNLSLVQYLLDNGAPIQISEENPVAGFPGRYESVLPMAADGERTQLVKLLLARGADVKIEDARGFTALDAAADRNNEPLIRILGQAMADAYPEDGPVRQLWSKNIPFSRFAFIDHVRLNDKEAARLFLEGGMDINAQGKAYGYDTYTALEVAAREGNSEMVRLLLAMARPGNKPDLSGPLEMAVWKNRTEVVTILLESGADPASIPIRDALKNLEIAKLLLAYGADINKSAGNNNVPALVDVLDGSIGMGKDARKILVKFLLEHGADPKNRGEGSKSPLELARAWGDPEVIGWIAAED